MPATSPRRRDRIDATLGLLFVSPFRMHIDREALYTEYEPKVRQLVANKAKRMQRDGKQLVDANALEGEALSALKRAADQWQGAGEFEPYLRVAIRNAWRDDQRKERRHAHAEYPTVKDSEKEGGGEMGLDGDPVANGKGGELPVFRARRKGFRGGDSVVVVAVVKREEAEAIFQGGLAAAMRKMGFSEEDIKGAKRRKDCRWQQQDRRHPEMAKLRDPELNKRRFNALFRDAPSATG